MPTDKHLNIVEITDFTSGLYDELPAATNVLGPIGAMAVLTDYEPRPMPGGGLRAFYQGAALTTTGIGSPTNQACMGIWANGSLTPRGNAVLGFGYDRYIATMDIPNKKSHVYRMDGTNDQTQWQSLYTDSAGAGNAGFESEDFVLFQSSGEDGGSNTLLVMISHKGGSAKGVYQSFYIPGNYTVPGNSPSGPPTDGAGNADGKFEFAAIGGVGGGAGVVGPINTSQARMLYGSNGDVIYSDIGRTKVTSSGTQRFTAAPNQPDSVLAMISTVAPSDLLLGFHGAPWYTSSGDFTQVGAAFREMGNDHHQRQHFQRPVKVPGGIAFIEPGGKVYVTDGRNFKDMSPHTRRFDLDAGAGFGPGQLAFQNHYIFAPGGRVLDLDTGAWFQSSLITNSVFHYADPAGIVYIANAAQSLNLGTLRIFEGGDATVTRMPSGSGQTVPFGDATGRNVRIRQVEMYVQCYATSSITVSILDSGNNVVSTWTESNVSGREAVQFLFPNVEDDYLSVSFACSANNGTSEAPTIERMRIFFGPNNLLTGANAPE